MRGGKTAALALVSILAWACDGGNHGEHPQAQREHSPESAGQTEAPRLNGVEKWEMDDHTRTVFATMVERVEEWGGEDGTAERLGRELDEDLDALIQGCTMTGDAHAELHKFLMVLIPAVDELAARGGEAEVRAVKELLASYPRYFE